MRVAVLDLGTGNLHSLAKAIAVAGATVSIEANPARALAAEALVLPGVGHFGAAARRLTRWRKAIRDAISDGLPCLGICLGMQLLFEWSEEGPGPGLGVLTGHVRRLRTRRVPHMGWNTVEPVGSDPLFREPAPLVAYYANSYVAEPVDRGAVIAWTEYEGQQFPAAVRQGTVWGVQFHPEKSGGAGLEVLRNFVAAAGA
jgi:glutamine amidotransferase